MGNLNPMPVNQLPSSSSLESLDYFVGLETSDKTASSSGTVKKFIASLIPGYVRDSLKPSAINTVYYATVSNLDAFYFNGDMGVGATLTSTTSQQLEIEGYFPLVGYRILVKNQLSSYENGIYVVTNVGSSSQAWQMVRSEDFNSTLNIVTGAYCLCLLGDANELTSWALSTIVSVVGSSPIEFFQTRALIGGSQSIQISSSSFSLSKGNRFFSIIINSVSLCSISMDETGLSVGDSWDIQGNSSGLFRVVQSAGQTIKYINSITTPGAGGYIETQDSFCSVKLMYIGPSDYVITSSSGDLIIV